MIYFMMFPYGGFHSHGGSPSSLDGLFHGKKKHLEMDDESGYPYFGKPPYMEVSWNRGSLKMMVYNGTSH